MEKVDLKTKIAVLSNKLKEIIYEMTLRLQNIKIFKTF